MNLRFIFALFVLIVGKSSCLMCHHVWINHVSVSFMLSAFGFVGSVYAGEATMSPVSLPTKTHMVSRNVLSLTQTIAAKRGYVGELQPSFLETNSPASAQPRANTSTSSSNARGAAQTTTITPTPPPAPAAATKSTTSPTPLAATTSGDGDVDFLTAKLEFSTTAITVVMLTALFIGMALGIAYRSYSVQNRSMSSTRAKYRAFAG